MPGVVVGWITLSGTPGAGIPAGTLLTTPDGQVVHLAQPAVFGPEGRVSVPVAASRPEDIRAFQASQGLPADGIVGQKTARVLRLVWPTRYSMIMADEDWWS